MPIRWDRAPIAGLEAVSNSMPVMREPRVATAQRTMGYMAWSLAFMAGGLIVAYLLLNITPPKQGETQTMNSLLSLNFVQLCGLPSWAAKTFMLATLLSEGLLLVVAAQAGFIDGPRVLGYMAHDCGCLSGSRIFPNDLQPTMASF